ncbi:DNA gyrase inhibitor YacG [Asticcacaulis sp. AC402]|uniref:DNA gyrase inhibitor YacG n=1 Tax=Asticcacaulis sp. AC402 TaxID=1282361 RepID=UPI001F2B6298|nr:DNA gyrase inhibitor YacG [Asticcacaulis sp. AC402]
MNAAPSYAPFCSKRCADVDLVHWLKGEYIIGDDGDLSLAENAPDPAASALRAGEEEP